MLALVFHQFKTLIATAILVVVFSTIQFTPIATQKEWIRPMAKGLVIKADRMSPAFSALEDTRQWFQNDDDGFADLKDQKKIASNSTIELKQKWGPALKTAIEKAESYYQSYIAKQEKKNIKYIGLAGLTLNAKTTSPVFVAQKSQSLSESKKINKALKEPKIFAKYNTAPALVLKAERNDTSSTNTKYAQRLSPLDQVLSRIDRPSLYKGMVGEMPVSFEQKAKELVRKEVIWRQQLAMSQSQKTEKNNEIRQNVSKNPKIVVYANAQKSTNNKEKSLNDVNESRPIRLTSAEIPHDDPLFSKDTPGPTALITSAEASTSQETQSEDSDPNLAYKYYLTGMVQSKGLPITGESIAATVYQQKGSDFIEGRFEFPANFEIQIQGLEGQLVVEFWSKQKGVIGRGVIELNQLKPPEKGDTISHLIVEVQPVELGLRGEVLSAYSYLNKKYVPDARLVVSGIGTVSLNKGQFSLPQMTNDSSVGVYASAPEHWPTVVLAGAGYKYQIPLFHDKYLMALLESVGESVRYGETKSLAIVMGQIKSGDVGIAGAKVKWETGEKQPFYWNGFLVDPSQQVTGENGQFAFISEKSGEDIISIQVNGQKFLKRVIYQLGEVTFVPIEVSPSKKVLAQFKGIFDGQNSSGRIQTLDGKNEFLVYQDGGTIEIPGVVGTNEIQIFPDAPSFEPYLTTINQNARYMQLPLFEGQWLKGLADQAKIVALADKAIFVGSVKGAEFKVEFDFPEFESNLIYFDSQGNYTTSGVVDGGFLLLNIPDGLRRLRIIPSDLDTIHIQEISVDSPDIRYIPAAF